MSNSSHDDCDRSAAAATTTAPRRQVAAVRFFPSILVRETVHHADYTPQERTNVWYTKQEYGILQAKNVRLVHKLQGGQADKFCTRGLEGMYGPAQMNRVLRRAQLYAEIMDAQDEYTFACEDSNSTTDDDYEEGALALQEISERVSLASVVEAQERALRDALAAAACYASPKTKKANSSSHNNSMVALISSPPRSSSNNSNKSRDQEDAQPHAYSSSCKVRRAGVA